MFRVASITIVVLLTALTLTGCNSKLAAPTGTQDTVTPSSGSVTRITVNANGFAPEKISLPANTTSVLEFVRTDANTCATTVIFKESGIRHKLPLNTPVRVSVRPAAGQRVEFTCPMDMYHGVVTAENGTAAPSSAQNEVPKTTGGDTIEVSVDASGFHPANLSIPSGKASVLRFTRTVEKTCNTAVMFPGLGLRRDLPVGQPIEITLAPQAAGTLTFTCPMEMSQGTITVTPAVGK